MKAMTVKRRAGNSCSQSNVMAVNADQRVEIGLGDEAVLIGRKDGSVEAAQPDLLDVRSIEPTDVRLRHGEN